MKKTVQTKKEDQIELLAKQIQEKVACAVTREIIKNRGDHLFLVKNNIEFKEATTKIVNKQKQNNEAFAHEIRESFKTQMDKNYRKWNSSLGGIKTNWNRKLEEAVEKEKNDRIMNFLTISKRIDTYQEMFFNLQDDCAKSQELNDRRFNLVLIWAVVATVAIVIGMFLR